MLATTRQHACSLAAGRVPGALAPSLDRFLRCGARYAMGLCFAGLGLGGLGLGGVGLGGVGLVGLGLVSPSAAEAQAVDFRSTRTVRPSTATTATPQTTGAAARAAAAAQQNRRLISGLGSAANVSPGWYARNLSQPVVEGGSLGHLPYFQPLVPLHLSQIVVVQQPAPLIVEAPPPQVVVVERDPPREERRLVPSRPERWESEPARDRWANERAAPRRAQPPPTPPAPRFEIPQRFTLRVAPADAMIYLDDERLGRGGEIVPLLEREPLHLEPGVHVLEVSHPDLPSQRLVFGIADEPVSITVDLAADRPSRRALVR